MEEGFREEKCCGTCKYHRRSYGEVKCMQEASIGYTFETDSEDACSAWEGRECNAEGSHEG